MPNPIRRAVALAALAVAIVAGAVALDLPSAAAQSDDEQTGRIVAQRLEDGRTEFGWQPAGGERILPRARYFPADAQVDRWLNSSPVEVDGVEIGRINARLRDDGRIEFAFTPTDGERIEPPARYFPVDARVGRWLRSTEIAIVAQPQRFIAVSAGRWHTCGLRGTGEVTCWGANADTTIEDELTVDWGQANAPTGIFTAVSASQLHTCGVRDTGKIVCWGGNIFGQSNPPAGSVFTAVTSGYTHTCGLHATGGIECWGGGWAGANADFGQVVTPVGSFTAVSAGWADTCGLRTTGEIECWGRAGNGTRIGTFTAIGTGGGDCAVRGTGEVVCWVATDTLQTGTPAGSFTTVSAGVGLGAAHKCGLRTTGEIMCWGANDYGQTEVPDGRWTAVSAGDHHTCGVRTTGEIACWGRNHEGQTDAPTP